MSSQDPLIDQVLDQILTQFSRHQQPDLQQTIYALSAHLMPQSPKKTLSG